MLGDVVVLVHKDNFICIDYLTVKQAFSSFLLHFVVHNFFFKVNKLSLEERVKSISELLCLLWITSNPFTSRQTMLIVDDNDDNDGCERERGKGEEQLFGLSK